MVHESKVSTEHNCGTCAHLQHDRTCAQPPETVEIPEVGIHEIVCDWWSPKPDELQALREEEYPLDREHSKLKALREAVRRAEEAIMVYLGAGGGMEEAIVGILREETGLHIEEESS